MNIDEFDQMSLGDVAEMITENFAALTGLITGGSYIAGLAFSIEMIMKFKQHKDNPTQIPIGTPIALAFIAAALLFFPPIIQTQLKDAGYTSRNLSEAAWNGDKAFIEGAYDILRKFESA